jgi:hypothetical protein
MRRRAARGMTILELVIGGSILVGILAAADLMFAASSGVARSANDQGVAANRVARSLRVMTDALRRGSLASARRLDGSGFMDGDTDTGFQIRTVQGYSGSAVLSSLCSYRLEIATGATSGQVIRSEDGYEEVLANGVTALTVTRSGNIFTFDVSARSGPEDDRGRVFQASEQAAARNP